MRALLGTDSHFCEAVVLELVEGVSDEQWAAASRLEAVTPLRVHFEKRCAWTEGS